VTVRVEAGTISSPCDLLAVQVGTTADIRGQGMEMDDAPYTGDLDLAAVGTRDDLLALLRMVYIRADKPALRTLEAKTRHSTNPLSKTSVAEMLNGVRFPRKAVMIAFVRACGVPDDATGSWRRAWERVATSEEAARSGAIEQTEIRELREQVSQLNADNEKLRLELAKKPDSPPPQDSSAEQARLLQEISTLRSLLASVAESAAKSVIPDIEQTLQSAELPDKVADEVTISLKSATSASALDVLVRASIGTLLNEHGEVSVPRLLREIAHAVPDASPSAISVSLEELGHAGKVSWLGDDVLKAGVIRVNL
jgi:hypothetical protein